MSRLDGAFPGTGRSLGAEHVLNYLARCTHRVAISRHRLVAFENDRVSFLGETMPRAARSKKKVMTVSVDEFLRRFLLHVLPKGLVRIRTSVGSPSEDGKPPSPVAASCSAQWNAQIAPKQSCVVPPAPAPC